MANKYTKLFLYRGVILDPRYEHTILWNSVTEKQAYFASKIAYQLSEFAYLRKEKSIKVPFNIDQLEGDINYCMAINAQGNEYYYFINDKEYVSENVTLLHLQLDLFQTYQHKMSVPACFVEREHVSDDSIGKNLVEEGLETGEYITTNGKFLDMLTELCIVVQTSVALNATPDQAIGDHLVGDYIGGVYSGYRLFCCSATHTGLASINTVLAELDTLGKSDGVASIWMYPKALILANWEAEETLGMLPVLGVTAYEVTSNISDNLDGYIPHNNKLLSYPYKFINISNISGNNGIIRYEQFEESPAFAVFGSVGVDGTVRLVPKDYRGFAYDHESGISLTGFPTCAWTQDAYKIWLAQNANTQELSLQSGAISMGVGATMTGAGVGMSVAGAFTGGGDQMIANGVNMMYSGYQQIAGVMAARSDKQVIPPQAKGAQSSNVNIAYRFHSFLLSNMSIQAEYAKRIDSYFDMYGYKVNAVKVPNLNTRAIWNYVKTIGCVVVGDIDSRHRQEIAAIFDKGITCWHSVENMYNYNAASLNTVKA